MTSAMGGSDTAQVMIVSHLSYPFGQCEGDFNGDGDQDGLDLERFALDQGRDDCP